MYVAALCIRAAGRTSIHLKPAIEAKGDVFPRIKLSLRSGPARQEAAIDCGVGRLAESQGSWPCQMGMLFALCGHSDHHGCCTSIHATKFTATCNPKNGAEGAMNFLGSRIEGK